MTPTSPLLVAVEGIDGAGKTTLIRGLEDALRPVRAIRPARVCMEIFRSMAEPDDTVLYQDVIPGPMRRLAQLVELSAQLRYRAGPGERPDLLFDRWAQSAAVHCGPHGEHRGWLEQMEDLLPRPDPLLWVRVPPALAYERLVARGDRRTRTSSPAALRARLVELADGYEQVMADAANVVVLDGSDPRDKLLAQATAAVRRRATPTAPATPDGPTTSGAPATPGPPVPDPNGS